MKTCVFSETVQTLRLSALICITQSVTACPYVTISNEQVCNFQVLFSEDEFCFQPPARILYFMSKSNAEQFLR
jgi:hypothetical protein